MTCWAFATLGVLLAAGVAAVAIARLFGRPGSRGSMLVSVIAHWLGAWVLWSFAGGLATSYGLLTAYHGALFGALAVAGGLWHYRVALRAGREQGLAVFVGGQLVWLAIVLVQNGVLR